MLPQSARTLAAGFRELLFPSMCLGCGNVFPGLADHFCPACTTALIADPHRTCPRCCSSIGEFANVEEDCPRCRGEKYHFERSFRLGPYEGLLREMILQMKSSAGEMLAECLGRLWAKCAESRFREAKADIIIPVPLHWRRKWDRGFNQSEALSEAIADHLGVLHAPRWLKRVTGTPFQTAVSPAERRQNLRGAFRASRSAHLAGKTVLLIDDVLTTGSTLSGAARALHDKGAARVIAAVLAHH
jgi:ComF family protein